MVTVSGPSTVPNARCPCRSSRSESARPLYAYADDVGRSRGSDSCRESRRAGEALPLVAGSKWAAHFEQMRFGVARADAVADGRVVLHDREWTCSRNSTAVPAAGPPGASFAAGEPTASSQEPGSRYTSVWCPRAAFIAAAYRGRCSENCRICRRFQTFRVRPELFFDAVSVRNRSRKLFAQPCAGSRRSNQLTLPYQHGASARQTTDVRSGDPVTRARTAASAPGTDPATPPGPIGSRITSIFRQNRTASCRYRSGAS